MPNHIHGQDVPRSLLLLPLCVCRLPRDGHNIIPRSVFDRSDPIGPGYLPSVIQSKREIFMLCPNLDYRLQTKLLNGARRRGVVPREINRVYLHGRRSEFFIRDDCIELQFVANEETQEIEFA